MSEAEDLLKEHVDHARTLFDRQVSVTMAVLAVLLAMDALFSHRAHTEELLNQAKASDQWAFYQAKTIRRTTLETASELAHMMPAGTANAQATAQFVATAQRYEHESKEIESQAREFERERDHYGARANRYVLAEIF